MSSPTVTQRAETYNQANWQVGTVNNIYQAAGPTGVPGALRRGQEEMLRRHPDLSGRDAELAQLDRMLASPRRHHFVWGPSGFGKSALLAHWIRHRPAGAGDVCFHFINRLQATAGEEAVLRSLCEQLAAAHGLDDSLAIAPALLRATLADLLRRIRSTATRLIVVVDGLDEAMQWSPGGGLFPPELPEGTDLIFSARADHAEQRDDWLRRLGLDPARVDCLPLGALTADNIAALLRAAGPRAAELAANPAFVREVLRVSNGDPFYLRFLAEDIQEGRITAGNVGSRPRGLDGYLQEWTSTLYDDAGVDLAREEVYTLLGVLTSAHGPLKPAELAAISPHLRKGALLDRELRGSLRRYLAGSRASGYTLCHPRFRDFLCTQVLTPAEVADHRTALLDYCRRWREHRGDYALDHLAMHLEEAGTHDELFALLDTEWYRARRTQSGSPRRFGEDVERALRLARTARTPDLARIARLTLLSTSALSVAAHVAPELLGRLARLGGARSAWDYARFLSDPLRRRKAYLLIGDAVSRAGDPDPDVRAADLFAAAIDLALAVPDPGGQICGLVEVATTLLDLGRRDAACELLNFAAARGGDLEGDLGLVALVWLAATFRRAGELSRIQPLLQQARRPAQDATDVSVLAQAAELCAAIGDSVGAADFARWAKDAAGKSWMLFGNGDAPVARALRWAGATAELEAWVCAHDSVETCVALAEIEHAQGQPAAALALATRARDRSASAGAFNLRSRVDRLDQVARLFLRLGHPDTARAVAQEARTEATQVHPPLALGVGSPAQNRATAATLLADVGESDAATAFALESLAALTAVSGLPSAPLVDLLALIRVLQRTGRVEDARDLTLRMVPAVDLGAPAYGQDPFFPLVDGLESLGEREQARQLVERRLQQGETVAPEGRKSGTLAILLAALPAATAGNPAALAEIDGLIAATDALPATHGKARALGQLAAGAAAAGLLPQCEQLLARIAPLPGTAKAIALTGLALHHARTGQVPAACSLLDEAQASLGPTADDDVERRRVRVALAEVSLAVGRRDEAAAQARSFLAQGTNQPMSYPLAADSAWILARAGDPAGALPSARECLRHGCQFQVDFLTRDLPGRVNALLALQEPGRATELVRAAARAVAANHHWVNKNESPAGLKETLRAALAVADTVTLERLVQLAAATPPPWLADVSADVAHALADAGRIGEAGAWAERALAEVRRSNDPYWTRRHLPFTARALALAGRTAALTALRDETLALPEAERASLLPALLPAFATLPDLAVLEAAASSLPTVRPSQRASVAGALALALAKANRTEAARTWSARALAEFDRERDGAVTPAMLPHLVPMLIATRDREGLLHLLRIPAAKAPYPREWVPLLRAVLPALADLGHIDLGSDEIDALRPHPEAHGDVLAAIGEALVREGRLDEARTALAAIKSDDRRADAWLAFVPVLAGQNRSADGDEILRVLSTRLLRWSLFPARLGALAVTAARHSRDRHLAAYLKQRFLALPPPRLVALDPLLLFHATRALAAIDGDEAATSAPAILNLADHPDQRGPAGAALARALAESGHLEAALPIARDALAVAQHRPETGTTALAVFAQAGQWTAARAAWLQALEAARPLGRDECLDVIASGARLAAAPGVSELPLQLWQAIQQADRVWAPPAA